MADIFVSYAREDAVSAEWVVAALKKRRWSVFSDRSIPVGKQWDDVLRGELNRARCVVVLWSSHSLASECVMHEASIARHRGILIPALLEPNLATDKRISTVFRSIQSSRLIQLTGAGDPKLQDLVDAVGQVLAARRSRLLVGSLALLFAAVLVAGWQAERSLDRALKNARNLDRAGVAWVEYGNFSPEEDVRARALIRGAYRIDILASNASSFIRTFKDDLKVFFARRDSRMRVLLASPQTHYYTEMMSIISQADSDPGAKANDETLVRRAVFDLMNHAELPAEQLAVRYYNTQHRMPVILIDDAYCLLTVRLPPDEARESLRLEIAPTPAPVASAAPAASAKKPKVRVPRDAFESCRAHFEAVWSKSEMEPHRDP